MLKFSPEIPLALNTISPVFIPLPDTLAVLILSYCDNTRKHIFPVAVGFCLVRRKSSINKCMRKLYTQGQVVKIARV